MAKRKRRVVDNRTPAGIVNDKPTIMSAKKALDAYSNIPANLGVGSNNLAQAASYVMRRFTWD